MIIIDSSRDSGRNLLSGHQENTHPPCYYMDCSPSTKYTDKNKVVYILIQNYPIKLSSVQIIASSEFH